MLAHLIELRRRLLQSLVFFLACALVCFWCSDALFQFLTAPLTTLLQIQAPLIATELTTGAFTPFKIALNAGFLLTMPYLLYQIWGFVHPGLYRHEKKGIAGLFICSFGLFLLGSAFCFYVALPFILQFLIHALPAGVRLLPDMGATLDFITRMLTLFGLCFQVPLFCVVLVKSRLVSTTALKHFRRYWIVSAFILGMIFAPPDVLSQTILALPLCVLYEIGIIAAKVFSRLENNSNPALERL